MKRRDFIQKSAVAGLGLTLVPFLSSAIDSNTQIHSEHFRKLTYNLLKDWCDGLIKLQVINPSDSTVHGVLKCPACKKIHPRCMDAVYPLLYMAKATGNKKYLDAGIAVFEWSHNVTRPDGAWTNELNPKSWDGISVFGAIALAEALHHHGDLLEADRRQKWKNRLSRVGDFIYEKFPAIDTTNVNYGATSIYALNLIGRVLNKPEYIKRSRELAKEVKNYFTQPNAFLFGEIKPATNKLSAKGLYGIDLGYNVEESLNNIVLYALQEKDKELLQLLTQSLNTHLEFMLPDGAWDNSWGTRQFKWSYWGSRTCDGCSIAFGMMAHYNPAFGTAAFKNTELLKRCTADGLLHGGPHFIAQGIKPCVHHTFEHAKPLASLLDHWKYLPSINKKVYLPRTKADGVKHFKELDTTLFARGNWRGTVTAYDANYYNDLCRQATGGTLSVLFHNKVGLLLAASMAVYEMIESNNQQPLPGEDIALTPRIETFKNNTWYTNLFDLGATIKSYDSNGIIKTVAQTQLKNKAEIVVTDTASDFGITYECSVRNMQISAKTAQSIINNTAFVLPVISSKGEKVKQLNPNVITIQKPQGLVTIKANVPLEIKEVADGRIFNMVPGAAAVPILAFFQKDNSPVEIIIEVV